MCASCMPVISEGWSNVKVIATDMRVWKAPEKVRNGIVVVVVVPHNRY